MRILSLAMGLSTFALGLPLVGCTPELEPTIDEPTGQARVRVAHLSPDAPAVDFCLAPADTAEFIGPVLLGAGAPLGVEYANVTKYFDVPAGQYDVRIVAPASDCSRGLLPDITDLPTLSDGAVATLAATGLLAHSSNSEPFALRAYLDELVVESGSSKLRFVHASPGTPAVDVGLGGGALFTPVFANIAYGATRTEDNGYVTTAPFAGVEISARATGTTSDVLAIKPAALPAGTIATAFAIGQIDSADHPLGVLLCLDNNPAHGLETECSVVGATPERARVRIAHLSPDAPAVDVCIKATAAEYGAPLLASLGGTAGLAYPQVTTYVELPIGTYDVRVVLATDGSCTNAAVPDTRGITVDNGLTATVAAIGVLENSGDAAHDPGFQLKAFVDATSTGSGMGKLRFIHASPGTPPVTVGLGEGHGFQPIFRNVAFGSIATAAPVDNFGFVEAAPFTSAVSARLVGSAVDALTVRDVTLAADTIATAIAIGGKTGSSSNPLRVLLCADNAARDGLLTRCAIAP